MIIKELSLQYPQLWKADQGVEVLLDNLLEMHEVVLLDEFDRVLGLFNVDYLPPIEELIAQQNDKHDEADLFATILEDVIKLPVISESEHIFNAIRLVNITEEDKIAVISDEQKFIGLVQFDEVKSRIINSLNLELETGVLLIELNEINFSLSQIIQIIEQEGLKVLGVTVNRESEQGSLFQVSIKLNSPDTIRATASLKRFGYQVTDFSRGQSLTNDMKSRVDELMHFLSI